MRGGCCLVAIKITVWTIYIWKHFFGAVCLRPKSQGNAQNCLLDCLLVEDLSCEQSLLWETGCYTIISCEGKILVGISILPLICWQGQGDRNKRNFCWDPKARNCHSKRLTQPLWTYKYICTAIRNHCSNRHGHHCHRCSGHCPHQQNCAQQPTSTEEQQLNYEPHWTHGGDYLPLAPYRDSLLLFPIFSTALLPFPVTLICTYEDSFASISYLFYSSPSLPHYPNP